MTREEIIDTIYKAQTLEAIYRAEKAEAAWLKDHPDDEEVRGTAELLIRTEQAVREDRNKMK